jgi:UbiD family decarboxylase
VVYVKALYHRNDPILYGRPPLKADDTFYSIPIHSVPFLWNQLEKVGIPGIKGVWVHGRGARVISVVSIKQMYLGHARQVNAMAAALLSGGALAGKWSIVVDDDIDPSDWEDVLWALCTRCDPETSIEIVRGFLTSPLDPTTPPEKREKRDFTTAKVLINACRPYHWMKDFAVVNLASPELREKVFDKWSQLFT